MLRLTNAGAVVQVAVALAVALVVTPIVRSVTIELNTTMGRAWPFSLARCHAPTTPGCAVQPVQPATSPSFPHTRTGLR